MTPSETIEALAETAWKRIGKASGPFCLMLVRKRMSVEGLRSVAANLKLAAEEVEKLIAYLTRIREGNNDGRSQNSPASTGSPPSADEEEPSRRS